MYVSSTQFNLSIKYKSIHFTENFPCQCLKGIVQPKIKSQLLSILNPMPKESWVNFLVHKTFFGAS